MLFNSLIFLFAFLPITYLVFWRLRDKSSRFIWLSITGYVFYGWWNFKFCFLMLFSTLVAYFAGLGILNSITPAQKRKWMLGSIIVDLALLGFFKYYNFMAYNMGSLMEMFGGTSPLPHLNIILPVGISFYTFHTMSYVIDSYRGTIKPTRNFWEFSCYVSLFSQLVAGPIVRFRQIEEDLEKIDKSDKWANIDKGLSFLILGLGKKVLIADSIATIIDPAFKSAGALSTLGTWLLALGYTYQLYFDFSGYSDMAVGLGHLFGIRIPVNFNSPYKAQGIADFWRRWHISLSSWLRDYLYISLGGNRGHLYRNLFLTMLLGGLWHGAQWTFIFWGAYHGTLLIIQRVLPFSLPSLMSRTFTFFCVVIGWVFFRSESMSQALLLVQQMLTLKRGQLPNSVFTLMVLIIVGASISHLCKNTNELDHKYNFTKALALGALFILIIVRIIVHENSPFLYFQF